MPKLSNPTSRQLRDMLDRKQSAHTRNYGKCEHCGTRDGLTNSHIISRKYIKVQFDPRNLQCLCGSCHGHFEGNPILFSEFVEQSTCGKYTDIMQIQGLDTKQKPDYELWIQVRNNIDSNHMNLEEARQWLGETLLWTTADIPVL